MVQKPITPLAAVFLLSAVWLHAAERQYTGRVVTGPSDPGVAITDVTIDYRPGFGVYNPVDFPTVRQLWLGDGTQISFKRLREITFTGQTIVRREFVPENQRGTFAKGYLDAEGYRRVQTCEVQVSALTVDGLEIKGTLKNTGRVYLTGLDGEDRWEVRLDEPGTKRRVTLDTTK